jgi:hypothetical protein
MPENGRFGTAGLACEGLAVGYMNGQNKSPFGARALAERHAAIRSDVRGLQKLERDKT